MLLLLLGLAIFLGVHSVSIVAPQWRDRVVFHWGKMSWWGLYSLLSLLGLVLIIMGFALARESPVVWYVPQRWMRGLAQVLMVPVFPLLLAAYFPGKLRSALKHPMLVAVKCWALAHLLANGMAADVLLFGSLLAWAVVDRISLKRRPLRPVMALPASPANDLFAVILGLGLYVVFALWAHEQLFGVKPFP